MRGPCSGIRASSYRLAPSLYGCSVALAGLSVLVLVTPLRGQWEGDVALGAQWFAAAAGPDRSALEVALALRAAFQHDWDRGRQSLAVEPFLRWDPRGERTLFDLQAAAWRYRGGSWDVALGIREVFWGVTESRQLVDVINQRDPVVGGPGYEKLGQPLVSLATHQDWGSVDLMFMPYFRPRSYTGHAGLLWSSARVVESGAGGWRWDWAARWSHRLGALDFGLLQFVGTNREPRFETETGSAGATFLTPHYERITQTGADVQLLVGRWICKLEALTLDPESGRYVAATGGLEYAFADYLSVFGEYAFDSRGDDATTSFNDDVFAGARLWWQDGQLRAGVFVDRRTLNSVLSLSANRRLGNAAVLAVEAGAFIGREDREPPEAPRQHTHVALSLARYF